MDMKLNKYIRKKLSETWPVSGRRGKELEELFLGNPLPTDEDIEGWIFSWYKEIYDRTPPTWLAGSRWYDRRKKIEEEAKKNEA